jgi:antitoxin HicB
VLFRATVLPEVNGIGYQVRFPDLPEAPTGGADLPDRMIQAADCLAEAIAGRIRRGEAIPKPSRMKRRAVCRSVPLAPRLALCLALRESGIRNTELAKTTRSQSCSTQSTIQNLSGIRRRSRDAANRL